MKRSENVYISLCQHRNILINKQNTCEQNPFMNYCKIFHCNTHAQKHMFQQHLLLAWMQYAVRRGLLYNERQQTAQGVYVWCVH